MKVEGHSESTDLRQGQTNGPPLCLSLLEYCFLYSFVLLLAFSPTLSIFTDVTSTFDVHFGVP